MTDFSLARRNMVESQIRTNGVTDRRLIAALLEVPRERFVPATMRQLAYIDEDLPLKEGASAEDRRWLMEPMPFARLAQLAEIGPNDLVLDIGCASGYSTAVLARLAESVVGLEADADLASRAESRLVDEGVGNAAIVTGDMTAGYESQGPYDVIFIEGAVEQVPSALFAQLREGGRLVAAVADGPVGKATLFRSVGGDVSQWVAFDVNVHPLPGFEKTPEFVF
ncbi:protein-L-isoaspartate O-methyltransferase family protein [Microbaculum marinisediminis]|uniref:Protein-L-isoaspartate O-methyltransferase n=1 Tax=Microbaculum marinisediminis TaxID=2931392 RepID=A0AAW5R5V9_9HYPH|nr:protein-L-isoaspartate O-methyltransferase [Microbaculum sp. A6E488]MCT8974014.1 protein-L-isoaspartate O-methyltransferase [Microbaculum sp. A6E488]